MEDERYAIYHDALAKGHAQLVKYYKQLDNARAYILSLCTCILSDSIHCPV